ncbi:MAG: O-methyltransferase [Bacteroidales bacterium]|nr:O-methyltransferase [Bacteroidales bacterium]
MIEDWDVYKYIEAHCTPQGEALCWVERQTNIRTNHARMLSGAVQGRFLTMVVGMMRPRRVLELGTFTGYSAICLASGLPEGGHLDTLEINDEMEDLIREGFVRAGVADRITLRIGDCKRILPEMADCEPYDLVYIDANKREYVEYYGLVFDLVRPGGYIFADNVLWDGKLCEDSVPGDRQTQGIYAFNDLVASDPRVESVILPIRDGLNIIHKLQ